jgi:hypothetical protein
MPVGGLEKQCRDLNLAAERRHKPKERTWGYTGSQKRVTVVGRRVIRRAREAWGRKNVVRIDWTRNQAERGTPKRRKNGKRLWRGREGKIGMKNPRTRLQLRRKREFNKTFKKTLGPEIGKLEAGNSSRLQTIKNWTLWRGRSPPKRKKRQHTEQQPDMWEHRTLQELWHPLLGKVEREGARNRNIG